MTKYTYETKTKPTTYQTASVLIKEGVFSDARVLLVNDLNLSGLDAEKAEAYEEWEMLRASLREVRKQLRRHEENLDATKAVIIKRVYADNELTAKTVKERDVELKAIVEADTDYQTWRHLVVEVLEEKDELDDRIEEAEKKMGEHSSRIGWRSSIVRFYTTLQRGMPEDMLANPARAESFSL